jgi:hypothetical protein
MKDLFFEIKNCQRCNSPLPVRILSWFTNETICINCSVKETEIKRTLPNNGKEYEGCGYIPEIIEVQP